MQVTKDAKHYYAAYDLMKVTNSINLFALIDQLLEELSSDPMKQINEKEFRGLLYEIYSRINLMGRWSSNSAWGSDMKDDEELMRRYGKIILSNTHTHTHTNSHKHTHTQIHKHTHTHTADIAVYAYG